MRHSVRPRAGMRDAWRVIIGSVLVRMVDMDPELEAFAALLPENDPADPVAARELIAKLAAAVPVPEVPGLEVEDRIVLGTPDVPVRLYRPVGSQGALVWLHGGGWVTGDVRTEHPWATRLAEESGQLVISVGYRLAPEDPFPAALDDAYAVLVWAVEHAAELGVDPERIAIGGHSAGGCIAAGVTLRARDEGGPAIRYQVLHQPALDDRQETWSQRNFTSTPWLNRDKATVSWGHYLGGAVATPYAAPARAEDLSGLPPAYIAAAELCPNRDENIEYGLRLLQAGVPVELHQWAGAFHGSHALLSTAISQRQFAELGAAVRRALAEQP